MKNDEAIIVAFDGIDGTGKTTLIKYIKEKLQSLKQVEYKKKLKRSVRVLDLHMFSQDAQRYRQLQAAGELNDTLIGLGAFYYSTLTLQREVLAAKKHYDVILLDRARSSAYAYQILGDNLPWLEPVLIKLILEDVKLGVEPHYFYLRSSIERSQRMVSGRSQGFDHYDTKTIEYKEKIAKGYDKFFSAEHFTPFDKLTMLDLDFIDLAKRPEGMSQLDYFLAVGWNEFLTAFGSNLIDIVNKKD